MLEKLRNYLTTGDELNIILFKSLGVGGVGISFATSIYCFLTQDYVSSVINACAGFLALMLMYFVERTGKYLIGYLVVEIFVFMGLFAILYFTCSGIDGSVPYFFSFGLMFTFLMFEGKLLFLMESLLVLFYMCVFIASFRYPQAVAASSGILGNEKERLIGVFLPALSMGLIFLLYIWEYKKQKKLAEEANEAKSIFLANMSHEIRTPINAVLGFNEIILHNSSEEKTKEYAGYIDQSGQRLLRVVNEILDYSRVESGKSEITMENFPLKELAEEMKSMMAILAQNKSLGYKLVYDEKLHNLVCSDREKLVRILTNLLSNAFKYTNEGSVTLRMRQIALSEQAQIVYFAVEDTGIGIRMSEVDNLFHAYERADLMKNREIEGTGLGLAITEQLLHLLGSSVRVESTYGKGSIFSFSLSLNRAESLNKDTDEAKWQDSFYAPGAAILVVDDDEMNRRMMDSFLATFHIAADFAESGKSCLSMMKQKSYHLVLMDYMMPEMDGIAAMEKIRAAEAAEGKHTPIVVLTADVVDHTDRKLLDRGFDEFLSKPVDFNALSKVLLKVIPEELLIRKQVEDPEISISSARYEVCDNMLKGKGIIFKEGLALVNGDYAQYLRIASFFVNQAPCDMKKLQLAADEEDNETIRLCLHSLKGKAGSIGAMELKNLAQNLENRCRNEDLEYVLCSLDLVFLQWRRCAEGLTHLLETEQEFMTREESESSPAEDIGFRELGNELYRNLSHYEGKKAKMILEQMKNTEEGRRASQLLTEIADLIGNMEFEQAMAKTEQELQTFE